jgi:hypothetical protein
MHARIGMLALNRHVERVSIIWDGRIPRAGWLRRCRYKKAPDNAGAFSFGSGREINTGC